MENEEHPIAMFIRLQNGEDIIAETIELEDEKGILYMVVNPLKVIYTDSPHHGYLSISFIPWVFSKICDHQEFTIHAEDVMLISNVSEKMNDYYWSNLDTNKIEEPQEVVPETDIYEDTVLEALQQLSKNRTYH